jgi:hypothetical protein
MKRSAYEVGSAERAPVPPLPDIEENRAASDMAHPFFPIVWPAGLARGQ